MRIILQDKNELLVVDLPKEINGNYWVKDTNQQNLNLIYTIYVL